MVIIIDNYDSFTYNLVQYIGGSGEDINVFRNDAVDISDIEKMGPSSLMISPGPGRPSEAGISEEVIRVFQGKLPILGVCLGHQAIAEVFGSHIVGCDRIMHGKVSDVYHEGDELFRGIPSPFEATRYHSLMIDPDTIKPPLEVIAVTSEKEIMGVKHKEFPLWGVQFHPESVLTTYGKKIISNFLEISRDFYRNSSEKRK